MTSKSPAKVLPFPVRQWAASKMSAVSPDWPIYQRPIDQDLRAGLAIIRARARELAQNSDHAKGFLRIVRNNLVGKPGYVLQHRAQLRGGRPDERTRAQIEDLWAQWGERGACEVSGKYHWRGLQRYVAETVARDGEALLRIVYDGPQNFLLQAIDPEALDITLNGTVNGRQVRMGVELDDWRRPVAYHLHGEAPINSGSYRVGSDRYRVPAEEMIHVYLPEWSWQTRGVSWLAVAAGRLDMIRGTEDAEVTASRASAAKFAAYEAREWAPPPEPLHAGLVGADGKPLSNDPGAFSQDIAPGSMEVVPYGYELKMLDPQHPNSEMPDFLKWALRSVSTGMGVSYNTLGNDAEGVNYTSLRFFLGVERDHWMELQDWFEADLVNEVYKRWIEVQRLNERITLRPNRADDREIYRVYWQPRRWEGPDPAKQAQADETELSIGSATLTEILARKGRDFEDVVGERVRELARIKALAEQAGLTLDQIMPYLAKLVAPPAAKKPQEETDAEDD